MTDLPAPGLYANVPYADYDGWNAARSTYVRALRDNPPQRVKWMMDHPPDSGAFSDGRGAHLDLLEPDSFDEQYIVLPATAPTKPTSRQINAKNPSRETEEAIAWWAEFEDTAAGREIVTAERRIKWLKMRDAVYEHPTANRLLTCAGFNEVSVMWKDRTYGIACKARPDRLLDFGYESGSGTIVSLKMTSDINDEAFRRSIKKYFYNGQAYWECVAMNSVAPCERDYVFILVENHEDPLVRVAPLQAYAIDAAAEEMERCLATYAKCMRENVWPGFTSDEPTGLPPYDERRLMETFNG